ncbi:MAG TPA: IS630 family transposase, partial [Paracoccus sp.]|nr:IS630 family transposase [Paracoccus sp. (in: a-proteobacteria)]
MAPLRGWAPKGKRLPGAAPFGHWNTSTFIAALRH